jgi:hypothetical protein
LHEWQERGGVAASPQAIDEADDDEEDDEAHEEGEAG